MGIGFTWDEWWGCYNQMAPSFQKQARKDFLDEIVRTASPTIIDEILKKAPEEFLKVSRPKEKKEQDRPRVISHAQPPSAHHVAQRIQHEWEQKFGRKWDPAWRLGNRSRRSGWHR